MIILIATVMLCLTIYLCTGKIVKAIRDACLISVVQYNGFSKKQVSKMEDEEEETIKEK